LARSRLIKYMSAEIAETSKLTGGKIAKNPVSKPIAKEAAHTRKTIPLATFPIVATSTLGMTLPSTDAVGFVFKRVEAVACSIMVKGARPAGGIERTTDISVADWDWDTCGPAADAPVIS
jgi:hypothetical protein